MKTAKSLVNALGTATPHIASYVVFRKGDRQALVLRSNTKWMNGYYGLVSGKVENNENFLQAAIREAKEEAGVVLTPKDLKYLMTMHRFEDGSDWVDVFFRQLAGRAKFIMPNPNPIAALTGWMLINSPKMLFQA